MLGRLIFECSWCVILIGLLVFFGSIVIWICVVLICLCSLVVLMWSVSLVVGLM